MTIADLSSLGLFGDSVLKGPISALGNDLPLDKPLPPSFRGPLLSALADDAAIWTAPEYRSAAHPAEAWLMHAVVRSDNLWARLIERGRDPGPFLEAAARTELDVLGMFSERCGELLRASTPDRTWSTWQAGPAEPGGPWSDELRTLVDAWTGMGRWSAALPLLAEFVRKAGAGPMNAAYAFRWTADSRAPLAPVVRLDDVRLEHLVGQSSERDKVVRNTERLLAGLPAQHTLLYGDRGTGKSATVKALVHRFGPRGLRLVELPKGLVHTLPDLVRFLSGRGGAFIIFMDDLSFESAETEYKELKAFLEGSLGAPAPNVKVYATSNRRHLVREDFSDRNAGGPLGTADDEVRRQDSVQEKLSLADRFGLTVIFPSPDQRQYLEIVRSLARRHGIDLDDGELVARALQWATWYNGRSGRTAKQFIDELRGV